MRRRLTPPFFLTDEEEEDLGVGEARIEDLQVALDHAHHHRGPDWTRQTADALIRMAVTGLYDKVYPDSPFFEWRVRPSERTIVLPESVLRNWDRLWLCRTGFAKWEEFNGEDGVKGWLDWVDSARHFGSAPDGVWVNLTLRFKAPLTVNGPFPTPYFLHILDVHP
jgi:hypothetical protein